MLSILSSLYFLSLVLSLIALLLAGIATAAEIGFYISPPFATAVSVRIVWGSLHTVAFAAIVYCMIVILHLLIGGGTNAL